MEGAYHKILQSRSSIPSPQFQVFLDLLVSTVRDAIAVCFFNDIKFELQRHLHLPLSGVLRKRVCRAQRFSRLALAHVFKPAGIYRVRPHVAEIFTLLSCYISLFDR
jgi:hypothetical protein